MGEEAAEHLAVLMTDMFRLDPERTIDLKNTPPPDREKGRGFGWSEEKYEQSSFQRWDESRDDEKPRYEACEPFWMRISNAQGAHFVQESALFLLRA